MWPPSGAASTSARSAGRLAGASAAAVRQGSGRRAPCRAVRAGRLCASREGARPPPCACAAPPEHEVGP
eukprot:9498295-Pyramimonas_sp.AAC.1